jgi:branched-chain amino acid transport system substrate-binding protein
MRRLTLLTAATLAASLWMSALLPAPARAEIRIAVAGPMTGPSAPIGEQFRRGAEAAVADINAKGGVNGEKLALEVGDDVCDPRQAVAVANQLANRGVVFVAGHYCSGSSIPASDVYAEAGVLQISPGSTNPTYTERGLQTAFRVCGRDDQQGLVAGTYVKEHFAGKKIAILNDKSAYGKGIADETKKALNDAGIQEALYDSVTAGEKDYSAVVSRLKFQGIDVLYYGGYYNEAGLIVRQMRQAGMNTVLMGGDALVTQDFWTITGPSGTGTLVTFSPDPRKEPTAKEIVDRFRQQGYDPEGYTLYTYAAVQVFAQAAAAAGSTKLEALLPALHSQSFETVIGSLGFDGKGDVKAKTYVVYAWKEGKYEQVP